MEKIDEAEIERLGLEFEKETPQKIIKFALDKYGSRVSFASSLVFVRTNVIGQTSLERFIESSTPISVFVLTFTLFIMCLKPPFLNTEINRIDLYGHGEVILHFL